MPTVTETANTAEELQAVLEDDEQLNKLISEGKLSQFIEGYAENQADKRAIDVNVADQMKATLTEFLQDNGQAEANVAATLETVETPEDVIARLVSTVRDGGATHNPTAEGAGLDDLDPAAFLQAAYHGASGLSNSAELAEVQGKVFDVRNAYTTSTPSEGGLLVPEVMRSAIMQVALETALTRPRATVIPMSAGKLTLPAVEGGSNVSALWGGIQAYWEDEGEELTSSEAKFRAVTLDPKMLTALAEFTNSLIADAPALLSWFMQNMPKATAWFEDDGFIDGNGVNKPHGWLNASCATVVAPEGAQAADTIVFKNLTKMFSRMLPGAKPAWYVNQETFPELAELKIDTGSEAIWINNAQEGPPARIFGAPVFISEKMKALGDEGDIVLADLRYYLIGDRQSMELSSSPHQKFSSNRTLYKLIQRVDGRCWLNSAVTPKNGNFDLSPIVKLGERA